MALGGLGQGLAIRLRQQNEEKISDQQEQQKALNEGVARNVPGGITNRTEVTVRVQDDSGRSILDARGQREAQKIVLLALKGAQDQGKLAVNVV
jgi:C4-type Zn-finger protein